MARLPSPSDMIKININGTIGAAQTWSTGVWADAAGASNATSADCAAMAAILKPAVVSNWITFQPKNPSLVKLTDVSVYAYAGGSITSHANGSSAVAGTPAGSASLGTAALLAVCCSLLTGSSGSSFRGRMYWPVTGMGADATDLNWTATQVSDIASSVANMLNTFQAATQTVITNCVPVVYSPTRGLTTAITSVKVDSMPDTQHRRENKMGSARSSTASV